MQPEKLNELADNLFAEITEWKKPADQILGAFLRANRSLNSRNRRFIQSAIYTKLRELGNCPDWLLRYMPNDYEPLLEALNKEAPTDLRVNTLRAKRETLLKEFGSENAEPTPHSPIGIRLKNRQALNLDGRYEVQDEASQLAVLYANPQTKTRVLDYCAGAGGKTLAMAAQMNDKGKIAAHDKDKKRMKGMDKRIQRAHVNIVSTDKPSGVYDLVFVDAPCSGTGTWRRNPDLKWRFSEIDLLGFEQQQHDILEKAAKYVRPGGALVYATCSILPIECEMQIEWFLSEQPDFEMGKPFLQLNPVTDGTDGFFASYLVRKG